MSLRIFLPALAFALACFSTAQPTWRFHLAFEDGTGARDTIWMVFDTTATVGSDFQPQVDYTLGEGDAQLDYNNFNVFTWSWDGDSTKTHAYPYTQFPNFDGTIIDAINWVPPMTITWDTSLFHAPYLPYGQGSVGVAIMQGLAFSGYANNPDLDFGQYDLLISDSITVDFLSEYLFQFSVGFGPDDGLDVRMWGRIEPAINVWPNPAQNILHIHPINEFDEFWITDLSGRIVKFIKNPTGSGTIDITSLHPGTYNLLARSSQNQEYHGTFQKGP